MVFSRPRPRLRPLLLPVEHGGWGFLFEPIVIALVAAPSAAAVWLSLAALAAFLSRQPLKVALDDRRHRRRVPRTPYAWAIAAGYMLIALLSIALAAAAARAPFWWLALAVAPLASVTLWFDSRGESRGLVPEIAGATALGVVAAAAGLAAGWPGTLALALWGAAVVRVVPAIVTVRERVLRLHGQAASARVPAVAHAAGVALAAGLYARGLMPPAVVAIALFLAVRAAWDLRPGAPPSRAVAIGVRELVTGLLAAAGIGSAWAAWHLPR